MEDILGEVEENDYEILVQRTRGPTKVWDRIDHFEESDKYAFFNKLRMYKKTANIFLWSQFLIL